MEILLTFTGFHDPYSAGLIGEDELPGPILSLIRQLQFDRVILFSTPNTQTHTEATKEALVSFRPNMTVEVLSLPLGDPTDYSQILRELRRSVSIVRDKWPEASYSISVSSGTPQMHACWVLLSASGEIPARILQVRPPRFVTQERPVFSELDLTSSEFPVVKPNFLGQTRTRTRANLLDQIFQEVGLVVDHPSMKKAVETAAVLAPAGIPMLILGETGTGKELVATLIHRLSGRSRGPFIPVNCAAIPGNLAESILFGHMKGSFSGAIADQTGKFDQAHKGTLFLDELAELSPDVQSKLLRVLQDGMVEPLGSRTSRKVDVRIVGATNHNLAEAVRAGRFREDLYYRLAVGEILLPPLRDRRGDITKIALAVLDKVNASLRTPKRLSVNALKRLETYQWPGNARELGNVIERSVRLSGKEILDADDILIPGPSVPSGSKTSAPELKVGFSLERYMAETRTGLIKKALELADGNQSEAGRLLGISPQAVHKFRKRKDS